MRKPLSNVEKAQRIGAKALGSAIKNAHVVWFNYTLGNWKALVMSDEDDAEDDYVEVTFNAAKDETYVDIYARVSGFIVDKDGDWHDR